jgi:phosphoglycolate phosphatase
MSGKESRPVAIFDFDGTLVDSKEGILTCLKQTLQRRGLTWQEPLDWFIGPPAHVSMPQLLPTISPAGHREIVKEYRALYAEFGWSLTAVYSGVPEMLQALQHAGWRMFVCTAKRRDFALQILEHFGLAKFFEAVYADSVELPSHSKSELLARLLRECDIGTDAVMVGDRVFDMEAGHACGLRTFAVTYGYGSEAELAQSRPWRICGSPADVLDALAGERDAVVARL